MSCAEGDTRAVRRDDDGRASFSHLLELASETVHHVAKKMCMDDSSMESEASKQRGNTDAQLRQVKVRMPQVARLS